MRTSRQNRASIAFGSIILLVMSSMGVSAMSSWKDNGDSFNSGEASHVEVNNGTVSLEMNGSLMGNWTKMSEGTPRVDGYQPYPDMVYDRKAGVFIINDIYSDSPEKTWTFDISNNQWTKMNSIIGYYDYL